MMKILKRSAEEMGQTVGYKLNNGLATLADEEEACKKPEWAYRFARDIEGANIEKCQEEACKEPEWAYIFARDVKGADIRKCEEAAYKDPKCAYWFARDKGQILKSVER